MLKLMLSGKKKVLRMIKAIFDTNILVSALLSPAGTPAKIFNEVLNGNVILCFDSNIINEYYEVLNRPKFRFDPKLVEEILTFIMQTGISLVAQPLELNFIDKDDQIFYEVAVSSKGYLVTGNQKHFPHCPIVVTAEEFLVILQKKPQEI